MFSYTGPDSPGVDVETNLPHATSPQSPDKGSIRSTSLFRSARMSLTRIYIPLEIAQATYAEIGEIGLVQFRDLNTEVNAFQRAFVSAIRRLDEMERKIREIHPSFATTRPPPVVDSSRYADVRTTQLIDDLEAKLNQHEARVLQLNESQASFSKRFYELTEMRHVLRESSAFLDGSQSLQTIVSTDPDSVDAPLLASEEGGESARGRTRLAFVVGVIPRNKMGVFERVLWRVLRGNLYMNHAEIDEQIRDPETEELVEKNSFIIFAHGRELLGKIRKISESLGATLYPIDEHPEKRREDAVEVVSRIEDLTRVLAHTTSTRRAELRIVAQSIEEWSAVIKKEKAIYYAMNMAEYDPSKKAIVAEGWAPTDSLSAIRGALRAVSRRTGATVPPVLDVLSTNKEPPTHHPVNKFTTGFQSIINAYGVARYREVNPGLFTIITFPFLFAMMFGDVGHGVLLTLIGVFLTAKETSLYKYRHDEMFGMVYSGRYIILLMGIFSMYTGLIYNDVFSLSLDWFGGSGWIFEPQPGDKEIGLQTRVYPFGVDPAWVHAENKLLFINSYKMKQAVLIGVLHMSFGIVLQIWNHLQFKRWVSIVFEFIPQLIFMEVIFGYLCLMILYKWSTDWYSLGKPPPGILNTLIYMFLSPGTLKPDTTVYEGQGTIQVVLLLTALVCVPWMLVPKPLILRAEHNKKVHSSRPRSNRTRESEDGQYLLGDDTASPYENDSEDEEEPFDFGEIVVHQVIHTIEYCLSCISNTASYLRLWALSLAHAQLSEVLWKMVLTSVFSLASKGSVLGGVFVWAGFAVWFALTVFILLIMEGLSAFLHALRLHWVEIAQTTYAELGEVGLVQFRDLNPEVNAFQRAFVSEIRRLDEMERKIRFLESQLEKAGVIVNTVTESTLYSRMRTPQLIDDLEAKLNEHEGRVLQMNNSQETLNKRYLELTEMRHVLRETGTFFDEAQSRQEDLSGGAAQPDAPLLASEEGEFGGDGGRGSANLGFVAGVIPRNKMIVFERVLWRVLRGNLYMNYAEIEEPIRDPVTDEVVKKNVFIIFAHGKELLGKIRKISESLGATLYPVDEHPEKRREDAMEVIARIEDLNQVLANTTSTRKAELKKVALSVEAWNMIVKKEKAIYYAMNMADYDPGKKALVAEGWVPTQSLPVVQGALRTVSERTGATVPPILDVISTKKEPPTFHPVNKFTTGFQSIIDAYGVARYREVNPGLYTVVTFPFLFAMMFGDFGHGLLLTLIGVFLTAKEKSLYKYRTDEMFGMVYGGRYIILLMGIYSMYTGLIYNDVFSLSFEFFGGSGWQFHGHVGDKEIGLQTKVYPFGVDPAWVHAENKLLFINSYKMKQAVLLGVIHMSFGIVLQVWNHLQFKRWVSIVFEFVPQFIFMEAIFGYLCLMIIYKWSTDWYSVGKPPPGLLNTLIYMFLSPGAIKSDTRVYDGQGTIQVALLAIALICVPLMLLPKPFILRAQHNKKVQAKELAAVASEGENGDDAHNGTHGAAGHHELEEEEEDHFEFGEIMIHQIIHTIEFCLGCISNTASYLRLWALSLAHAQLSEVLWKMVLTTVFGMAADGAGLGGVLVWAGFAAWFSLTIFILLIMEGLSAFLHALRLHWVEFNNKFYEGSGRLFEPFSFLRLDEGEDIVVPFDSSGLGGGH
ncbi:H(+)-transporting V0 sector ATPase subunit a [Gonapodya sp. JEL0774]|nr:H(+)-transporting V0 sector ATPase subunit a [Gonapodya sp. JEL0774]